MQVVLRGHFASQLTTRDGLVCIRWSTTRCLRWLDLSCVTWARGSWRRWWWMPIGGCVPGFWRWASSFATLTGLTVIPLSPEEIR
jgi:hypothetical protein